MSRGSKRPEGASCGHGAVMFSWHIVIPPMKKFTRPNNRIAALSDFVIVCAAGGKVDKNMCGDIIKIITWSDGPEPKTERRANMGKYTADDIRVGVIYELLQSPAFPTGYKVKLLVREEVMEFDTVREVYDLQFSDKYFPYPCLGEINFRVVFDDAGVITKLIDMSEDESVNTIMSRMTIGTYAMFTKQITDSTPRVGEILRIEDGHVVLHGYEKAKAAGEIESDLHTGFVKELYDGLRLPIAPDAVVYTWDWSSATQPFARCTPEEAEARRYVKHFSVGALADVARHCYWCNFYSTRENGIFDIVKVFLNEKPGWE